jgi:flavorubredoxin
MAKATIIYESKYGNTKLVAETIARGIEEVPGIEIVVAKIGDVAPDQIADSDAILIGSPNHIGKATRSTRKFIDGLSESELKGKVVAVFDTYVGKDFGKATGKMESQISGKSTDLKLASSGLSVRVDGMKGPVAEGELSKCREFGASIAAQLIP